MRRPITLALLAVGAFLLALVPAAQAGAPALRTVERTIDTTAGEASEASVDCPRNYVALSGGTTETPDGLPAMESVPEDIHGWRFSLRAARTDGEATVFVRCVRVRIPAFHRVRLRAATSKQTFGLDPATGRGDDLPCRPGFAPTGYGWSVPGDAAERVFLTRAYTAGDGLELGLRNFMTSSGSLTVYARCLERRTVARRGNSRMRHRFRLRRRSFTHDIDPASIPSFDHRCPAGHASVTAGYELPIDGSPVLGLGRLEGSRGGGWDFANFGASEEEARSHLTCLNVRTRFKRKG